MLEVKIVNECVKFKYGEVLLHTMWCRVDEGDNWHCMDIEYGRDTLYSEWIAKNISNWSSAWMNQVIRHEEVGYCEICGSYTTTEVEVEFRDKKFPKITETYCDHLGEGTLECELIDQFEKVGIKLTIES